MNNEISPATMLALKKQVERAVRPVRAGKNRKLLMREELLAHLMGLYDDERPRQPDDATAIGAALAHFGDPQALTSELNNSVGWKETLNFYGEKIERPADRWFGFREGEPFWRFALRTSAAIPALAFFMAGSVLILGIWVLNPSQLDDPTRYPTLAKILPYVVLSMWCFLLAVNATYRALSHGHERPRWVAAVGQGAAWSALFVILSAALWWSITFDLGSVLERLPIIATSAFGLLPPILLAIAWIIRADFERQRPHREWQQLEIDA